MSLREKINIVASERDLSYCYLKTAEELKKTDYGQYLFNLVKDD